MKYSNIIIAIFLVFIFSCNSMKNIEPIYGLEDVSFIIEPCIVIKNDEIFMRFQIKIENDSVIANRLIVDKVIKEKKVSYCFSGELSFREYGNAREWSLEGDSIKEFVKNNRVFWLNPDGSEVKLKIIKE